MFMFPLVIVVLLAFCTLPNQINGLFEKKNEGINMGVNDDFFISEPSYSKPAQTREVFRAALGFNAHVKCNYEMHVQETLVRTLPLGLPQIVCNRNLFLFDRYV